MAERESSTTALALDSERAARLAEAGSSGAPLLVDAGGVLYRLELHPAGAAAPTSGQVIGEVGSSATAPDEFVGWLTTRGDMREVL